MKGVTLLLNLWKGISTKYYFQCRFCRWRWLHSWTTMYAPHAWGPYLSDINTSATKVIDKLANLKTICEPRPLHPINDWHDLPGSHQNVRYLCTLPTFPLKDWRGYPFCSHPRLKKILTKIGFSFLFLIWKSPRQKLNWALFGLLVITKQKHALNFCCWAPDNLYLDLNIWD